MAGKLSTNVSTMSTYFRFVVAIVTLVGHVLWITPAKAGEEWLGESAMRSAFAGKTLTGKYATGTPFTETYAENGSISYWDPVMSATGRWHASKQGFCTFYETMNGGCFSARKIGENCFEFYLIESQDTGPLPPREGQPYVAQGWYPDRKPTCEALTT
jgi:hypothetical protein